MVDIASSLNTVQFTPKKFCLRYKINRNDLEKNEGTLSFLNRNSSFIDKNFVGTPMTVVPIYIPFLADKATIRLSTDVRKQLVIGTNIKSYVVYRSYH